MFARAGHRDAVKAGNFLLESNIVKIIWLDTDLKFEAWEYFKEHRDKRYSFTDCTSFVLMKKMGIRHYIAFDERFRQAGFVRFR
jgi:predicted nucleic acid-binding protein